MNFYKEWADKHAEETDEDYYKYHKKVKGERGYIPKKNFFYDGILFEDKYNNARTKILFIAKECNAYDINQKYETEDVITTDKEYWARNEVIAIAEKQAPYSVFLNGLAMLANAIIDDNYSEPNKDITALYYTALINLNKRGGYSFCVWETLEAYVEKYKAKIKHQIELIDPDVIVCCGESVYELVTRNNLAPRKIIKCAFHPSYFSVSDLDKLHFLKTGEKPNRTKNESSAKEKTDTEFKPKGLIIDTNNYGGDENENEMMTQSRACAYGNSRNQLGRFNKDDYVLFYSSNKHGIIAVGTVNEIDEDDKTDTAWWSVKPIVPKNFKIALNNNVSLSIKDISKIIFENDHSRYVMNGTVKRKPIEIDKTLIIIEELKKKYKESESKCI